ncbi:MAG TPA: ribbon-helix-helix protein, CopG family [Syntrophomonas sp.]|nr:ribbon-helix-helix protein, CopG family [Syntrophomonas sp.]HRW11506.1 ribbon-helix-helix protein, CopG family [Syntrophomonas sp.]
MPDSKRISITIPVDLLGELDTLCHLEHKNRSEIVRQAIVDYLEERRKNAMIEQMKKGYLEMAAINLGIAGEDKQN